VREEGARQDQMLSGSYVHAAEVDAVSGLVGPLYFTQVEIAGIPMETVVDPGSSATLLYFELFKSIGKQAQIPPDALKFPDIILRDYSQRPIPIGARVDLSITWQGKTVTTPVYLRSDLGMTGEPCLLGTNVVIPLGMMVPAPGVQPRDVPPKAEGVVQLLQPHRVPSQCAKLVEAEFGLSGQPSRLLWFKPDAMIRETMGLEMEESVVSHKDGN